MLFIYSVIYARSETLLYVSVLSCDSLTLVISVGDVEGGGGMGEGGGEGEEEVM